MKLRRLLKSESYELHKLLLSGLILLSIVPMIIMCLALYKKSETIIRHNASSYTVQMLNKTNKAIDLKLQSFADNATLILHPDVQVLMKEAMNGSLDYMETRQLYEAISRTMAEMPGVTGMAVHGMDGAILARSDYPGPSRLPLPVIDEAVHLDGRIYWRLSPEDVRGTTSLQAVRVIKNMEGPDTAPIGLATFTVPESILLAMIEDLQFGSNGNVILLDRKGYPLSSPNRRLLEQEDTREIGGALEGVLHGEEGVATVRWQGEPQFVAYNISERTGLQIAGIVPQREMAPGLAEILRSGAVLAALLLLLAVLIAYWITRSIVGPIRKLVKAMQHVEKQHAYLNVEAASPKEIQFLTVSFNRMTGRLRDLIEDEKKAQLKMLESQINPHFLYNTLDTIYWMLYLKGEEEIGGMVVSTANILRYGIARNDKNITIRDEIDNIRDYLHIQQSRYGDRLKYDIETDASTLDSRAIKLMLQPLVENAVKHGIESDGHIRVKVEKADREIHIHVMDNGKGIPEEIQEQLRHNRRSGGGLGLFNVHDRIRYTFGEGYGLRIGGVSGQGAWIKVVLPDWTSEGGINDVQAADR